MGFRLVQTADGEFGFVCDGHENLNPMCTVELTRRKKTVPRQGKRPVVQYVVFLRISCPVCSVSVARQVRGVEHVED